MPSRFCTICLLALTMLFALPVRGQTASNTEPYILVSSLNDNSGLPQNSIIGQYIDSSSGMLWLATFGGLVRYNGISIKAFNPSTRSTLLTNKMVCLFKTTGGEVYGMNTCSQLMKIGPQEITIDDRYKWIWDKYARYIWFRGYLHSLDHIEKLGRHSMGQPPYFPEQPSWTQASSDYYVTALPSGRYAVTNRSNELLIYRDSILLNRFALPVRDTRTARICYSRDRLIVLDDQLNGASYIVSPSQVTPVPLVLQEDLATLKKKYPGKGRLYYNELNEQLIWQLNKTIYLLEPGPAGIMISNRMEVDSLPQGINNILYYPRHHTLFIGTTSEGLYVYRLNNFNQLRYTAPDDDNNVNSNYAQIIQDGHLLRTCRKVIFDLSGNAPPVKSKGPYTIWSSFSSDTRNSFYSHNDDSVSYYSADTKSFTTVYVNQDQSARDPQDIIKFTWLDNATGRLWIIGTRKWGYLLQGKYHQITPLKAERFPLVCYAARQGDHLLLASDKGLIILDQDNGDWRFAPGTAGKEIRFIRLDQDTRHCWFGTYGNGYGIYDLARDRAFMLPLDPRSYLSVVHSLIDDGNGYIWATTNKGLFRMGKEKLLHSLESRDSVLLVHYDYFDREDGLYTNEFNGGGMPIYNWWQNILTTSSINGITLFSPDNIPSYYWDEPIYIDDAETSRRRHILPLADSSWEFTAGERNIHWNINRACWRNAYGMRIEYRLDDEPHWQVLNDGVSVVHLESLSPGHHVLHVRNFAGGTGDNYITQYCRFYIAYYWYEKWWIVLALVAGAIAAFWILHVRNKRLLKQKKRLESTVAERTQSLSNSMEEVLQANLMLEEANLFKTKLISILMHDIAVPISSIEMVSGMLHKKGDRVDGVMRSDALKEINNTARQLMLLSDQLIQWTRIQENIAQPITAQFQLRPVLDELEKDLADVMKWKENTFRNNVSGDFTMVADSVLIHHLVFNLLINAIKYTDQGTIEAGAYKDEEGNVVIHLRDTGKGMPQYLSDQLKQGFSVASHAGTIKEKGWGLGYQLIFDLLLLLNGEIDIQVHEGEGTEVKVTIPQ